MRNAIYSCAEQAMARAFGDVRPHYGSTMTFGRGSDSGLDALDHIAQDAMTKRVIVFALPEWAIAMVVAKYSPALEQADRAAQRAAHWMVQRERVAGHQGFISWALLHWAERPRPGISAAEWAECSGLSPWKQRELKRAVKAACSDDWASIILPRVNDALSIRGLIERCACKPSSD